MTAIVAGAGLGLEQTSGRTLGGRGLLGWAAQGRGGDLVTVNAATGNLIIQKQDEFLIGRGPDLVTARTYNSLGQFTDDNGDNWRQSTDRRVFALTGTVNAAGSTIKRVSSDGAVAAYVWKGSYYETTDGAGAHDRLTYASNQWTWTDGDSRFTEVYSASGTDNWRIVEQRDLDNNKLTFEYTADKLTRVKTEYASHPTYAEYTDYVWTGANITSIVTGYDDLSTAPNTIVTLTRTRYTYDASNRLTQVTVDLSPGDNSIADGKIYTTTYTYVGATKLVSSIAQTDGSLLEITYDGSNRVTQVTQTAASGDTRITSFAYFADRTEVTDPRHNGLPTPPKTILYKNAANQLTKIVSLPAQTGATPQTVEFAYDAATGDVLSVTEIGVALPNRVTSYVYDTKGNVTRITDPNGNITERTYDANNSLTLETRTGSSSGAASGSLYTRYVYDGKNHLRYAIGAEGRVTEYKYLPTGELQFTVEYPEHPYAIGSSVPTESAMNTWRDGLADRSSTKIAEYRYDARGNVSETVQWGGALATGFGVSGSEGLRDSLFTYDQAGQLLQRSTAPHVAETFVYDGMGRVILSTDLAGGATHVIFQDAATTTVVKTAVTYNATTQTWDETASSYVMTSVYNKSGDLISTTDTGSTAGGNYTNGGTQAYLYDKNGQVRKITDATQPVGYKSYFLYDKTGRKVADIGHDGQLVEYRYDEAGRLAATVRYTNMLTAAQLATLDNPLSEVELGPSGSAFPRPAAHGWDIWQWSVYDAAGRVIETIEGDGSATRYEYDQADRLVKTTGFVNKLTSTQITAFMSAAPTALVLPTAHANDRITRTFFDRDGRLIGALNAEGHLSRCIYDSAGQKVQEIAYSNATQQSLRASGTFDQLLASITQDATKDISTRYVYDGQGLLRFTIDALNRVTENVYWANNAWNANGLVRKSVAYAAPLSVPNYKYATVKEAVAALASSSNDRATYFFYSNRAQLAYSVDATGAVTGLTYDEAGRVVKTTQYATRIADMTGVPLDDPWWMNTWATNNGTDVRITRNYYAERGELRFVVDAEGYVTRKDYDQEGRLFTQYRYATKVTADDSWTIGMVDTAPKGSSVATQFRYDRMGRLQDVYDGNGVRRFIGYYANGTQAWEIVSYGQGTDESRIRYFYDQAGKKTIERRMTSETQNATSQGTFDTLLNQAERVVSPNGLYSALLTREGELRVYHKGELIWTNGVRETVAGATYRLVAQSDGNLVIHRDVSGQYSGSIWHSNTSGVYTGPTFLEMQDDGNLVYKKGTDPASQTGSLWSTATNGVVASDPNASEFVDTTFTYDGLGSLTSVKDAKSNTTNFTHDKVGRVLTRTDALSGVTQFQYDAFGRGVKTIDARGNTSYAYFDQAGRVKLAIDAENYATRTTYTAFSEIKEVTRYYNRATGDLAVEPSIATHALDATTKFEYDKLGRVTKTIDGQADAQGSDVYEQYTLNAFGQRISVRNKLGGWTNYVYDKRGLLVTETLPVNSVRADGTVQAANVVNKFEYDSRGNRTKKIEAFGLTEVRTTTYEYDAADRLIRTIGDSVNAVASATGAEAPVAPTDQLFYDRRGNVIETIDAANARTLFWYDKRNRVTHKLSALGTLTRYFYDKNGNVTEARIYATPVALPADAKGLAPNGSGAYRTTLFSYDALNRLTQTATSSIKTGFYDPSLPTPAYTVATQPLTTTYVYDATGNVVKTTDANGKQTWSYYDKLGRKITQIDAQHYRTDWSYNSDANVVTERRYSVASTLPTSTTTPPAVPATSADDRVTEFTYDKMGRRLTEKRLGVLVHNGIGAHTTQDSAITYVYNGLGEVTRKTEATGEFISYAYDSSGRMTSEQRSAFVAFDGQTSVTPTVEYSYNGLNDLSRIRQLGSTGAVAAAERVSTYTYGAGGRLLTVTDAEGFARTYRYDAVGRTTREEYVRVMPTGSATEAVGYDYDLEGRVLQQGLVVYSGAWTRSSAAIDTAMMHYNAFGEVFERGMNGVYAEKFDYDDAGRLWRTTSGDGTWKYFMYDRAGNQTLAIASDGTNIDNQTLDWVLDRWGTDRAAIGTTYVDGVTATITRYDGRNQAIEVREPQRELSTTLRENFVTQRAYNAFGEVKSETNALGYAIDYAYNTMGRLIKTESPQVSITLENGTVQNVRPTEHRYYDAAGRLVASRDANGNLTRLTLLAGTGYGGAQALATAVTTADNAVVATGYDIHGDARKITDQIARITTQNFDRMGRLTQLSRPGMPVEASQYDGLGQRIKRWTNQSNPLNDPNSVTNERTFYDQQGRITQYVEMGLGGDTTSYAYAWNSAIATTGLGTFGGWTQTTTYANGKTLIEQTDAFGRSVSKTDLGAHVTGFTYDKSGRLTQRSGGTPLNYTYLNTGKLATTSTTAGLVTRTMTYNYDKVGNVVSEGFTQNNNGVVSVFSSATATYDALGRLTNWSEPGSAATPPSSISYEYDANGNIRRSNASFRKLNLQGVADATPTTQDYWYRYDALSRVVTSKGRLENGVIVRGTGTGFDVGGVDIAYDAAGQRAYTLTSFLTAYYTAGDWIPDPSYEEGGYWEQIPHPYVGINREDYAYDAAGRLDTVRIARSYHDYVGGVITVFHPTGPGALRGDYDYDDRGRMTYQRDYNVYGAVVYSREIHYQFGEDEKILLDDTYTDLGGTTRSAHSTYDYGTGATYALGSILSISTANYVNGTYSNASSVSNEYQWWDGAVQSKITVTPNTSQSSVTNVSNYFYDNVGGQAHLSSVSISDGRPRTVTFRNDLNGQVIRRDEQDGNSTNGDPHEIWYRLAGRQIGYVGNNGTLDVDYATSISNRQYEGTGPFRPNASFNTPDFDQSISPFTSFYQGSSGGSYTVRAGETLASIAAGLWGDSSLWYKIAEANGLSGQGALVEGQILNLPAGVVKSTHNSSTFIPYDPNETIGNTSPTAPPKHPNPKKNKCGAFGQILLVVIAVVVSIWTAGAASGLFAGTGMFAGGATALAGGGLAVSGGAAIAAGAIGGAVGSIVSQAVGVATGIQDKFSWNAVALSAISGGVGAGMGSSSSWLEAAAKGAAGNAITQGIAVATGLQDKFNWAGVAAAGVGAGVGFAVGRALPGAATTQRAAWYNSAGTGAAAAIASAGTRSLIEGSDFGDNILAALPDVIGQTIGEMVAGGIADAGRTRRVSRLEEAGNYDRATIREAADLIPQLEGAAEYVDADIDIWGRLDDPAVQRALFDAAAVRAHPGRYGYDSAEPTRAGVELARAFAGDAVAAETSIALANVNFDDAYLIPAMRDASGALVAPTNPNLSSFQEMVAGAVGFLGGVHDAGAYIADRINDNPLLSFGLLALDVASGPGAFVARQVIAHSPVGAAIETGVGMATDWLAGQISSIGFDPMSVYKAASGAILLGTLALGARKAIQHFGTARRALIDSGFCFVAGTLVATAKGTRPIETVNFGDLVLARNDATGETAMKRVVQLIRNTGVPIWSLVVAVDGGEERIGVTAEHPWRVNGEWRATSELQPGMLIERVEGAPGCVVVVSETGETADTFNFEVEDFHTYFVGQNSLWVHNTYGAQRGDVLMGRDGAEFSVVTPGRLTTNRDLRDDWERETGQSWPIDPATGRRADVSHREPLADGGPDHVSNIEPLVRADHTAEHMLNDDFSRWARRRY